MSTGIAALPKPIKPMTPERARLNGVEYPRPPREDPPASAECVHARVWQAARSHVGIFGQGYLMVTLQAAGVMQLAQHHLPGALVTSFAINLLWSMNVRGIARRGGWGGLLYALGAVCGTATGFFLTQFVYR